MKYSTPLKKRKTKEEIKAKYGNRPESEREKQKREREQQNMLQALLVMLATIIATICKLFGLKVPKSISDMQKMIVASPNVHIPSQHEDDEEQEERQTVTKTVKSVFEKKHKDPLANKSLEDIRQNIKYDRTIIDYKEEKEKRGSYFVGTGKLQQAEEENKKREEEKAFKEKNMTSIDLTNDIEEEESQGFKPRF